MSSNLKRYELSVECTAIEGSQTFACFASSESEAKQLFREGKCEIIDEQLEVIGLEAKPFEITESDDISSRLLGDQLAKQSAELESLKSELVNAAEEIESLRQELEEVNSLSRSFIDAVSTSHAVSTKNMIGSATRTALTNLQNKLNAKDKVEHNK